MDDQIDPAPAARRVAEATRGNYPPDPEDLRKLLAILDAVAKSADDTGRPERWRIAAAQGVMNGLGITYTLSALADAEAAARVAAIDTDGLAHEAWGASRLGSDEGIFDGAMRIKDIIDAAVRRATGLAEPKPGT